MEKYEKVAVDMPDMPMVPGSIAARKAVLKHEVEEATIYVRYSDWMRVQHLEAKADATDYRVFLNGIAASLLSKQVGSNKIVSPLSIFHALAVAATLTEGNTQREILSAMGVSDAAHASSAIRSQYKANLAHGGAEVRPSSMLWLDDSVVADQSMLKQLSDAALTGVCQGRMTDSCFKAAISSWLDEATGRKLSQASRTLDIDDKTKLIVLTTLYFHDKWGREFDRMKTATAMFHALNGDLSARFMRQAALLEIWIEDDFTAVPLRFLSGSELWLILPREGLAPEEVLRPGFFSLFPPEWKQRQKRDVHMWIPKFDLSQDDDILNSLKALGIHSLFSDDSRTPFLQVEGRGIKVDQVRHSARITVDERGCEASAYTAMMGIVAAGIPKKPPRFDFRLDRPFLFILTGKGNLPLFTGIVHRPMEA